MKRFVFFVFSFRHGWRTVLFPFPTPFFSLVSFESLVSLDTELKVFLVLRQRATNTQIPPLPSSPARGEDAAIVLFLRISFFCKSPGCGLELPIPSGAACTADNPNFFFLSPAVDVGLILRAQSRDFYPFFFPQPFFSPHPPSIPRPTAPPATFFVFFLERCPTTRIVGPM